MEFAFAAMMGWCGTKWPGWWRGPRPPQPDPWWWVVSLAGALGGIGAMVVFDRMIGEGGLYAISLVSFFGGVLLGSIVDGVGGASARAQG